MEATKHRDWSNLLPELLKSIARKLSMIDSISLSNVCSHWQQAMKSAGKRNPTAPWFILSCGPLKNREANNALGFVSMADDNRVFKLSLPPKIHSEVMCIGSSHGWLIIMDIYSNMSLVNPLSGCHIPLPSIAILPFMYANMFHFKHMEYQSNCLYKLCFRKAVLFAAPVLSRIGNGSWEFTVMILGDSWGNRVCFARADDKCWTILPDRHWIDDIIMHSNKFFYTIGHDLEVNAWEPCGTTFEPRRVMPPVHDGEFIQLVGERSHISIKDCIKYFVETTNGELLVVLMSRYGEDVRLLSWDKQRRWKKVESLGEEQVVFLGYNQAVCLPASACPKLRPNTIYYVDASSRCMMMLTLSADDKMAKGVKLLCPVPKKKDFLPWFTAKEDFPPIWFSPTMNENEGVILQHQPDKILDQIGFRWTTKNVDLATNSRRTEQKQKR